MRKYLIIVFLNLFFWNVAGHTSEYLENKVYIINNSKFKDSAIDSVRFNNIVFNSCYFDISEYIRGGEWIKCRIENSIIGTLNFDGSIFNNGRWINCNIRELTFQNMDTLRIYIRASQIANLSLKNISYAELVIIGGHIGSLRVVESNLKSLKISSATADNIELKGGRVDELDIKDIRFNSGGLVVWETKLVELNTSSEIAGHLNITHASIEKRKFFLTQEIESRKFSQWTNKKYELHHEAFSIYSALASQFANANRPKLAAEMEVRMYEADRKSIRKSGKRLVSNIWNKQLRGKYGYKPIIVLRSFGILWLFFAFVYYLMDSLKITWGGLVPRKKEPPDNLPTRILCRSTGQPHITFFLLCLAFSFERLLVIGSGKVDTDLLLNAFKDRQEDSVSIGIGRYITIIQNLIGLLLIYFFIQSFIKSL